MTTDPLALDPDRMRRMGYAAIDMLVERIAGLPDGPVLRTASRAEMAGRIDEPPPSGGRDFGELLERLDRDVLPYVGHFDHPRFFGYIPGAGTWPAALGDLIASATNVDAGAWREAAGPSQLELTVLDWFRGWIGYPVGRRGRARVGRVRRQPDRDRLCPRDPGRADVAPDRRLHERPDALVARPRRTSPRASVPTRSASCPRRGVPPSPRRTSRPPWTPTSPRAGSRSSSARTRARRTRGPSTRCPSSPRSAGSAASGSTWTARTGGSPS